MKEILLDFKKDRELVDYYWEQPNVPWLILKSDGKKIEEEYEAKICLDYKNKRVYIKDFDGEAEFFSTFESFLMWRFNLTKYKNTLKGNNQFFWDIITDLKRNLHNKQHQKIKLTIEQGHIGTEKIK